MCPNSLYIEVCFLFNYLTELTPCLMTWYDTNQRKLPWRSDPSPYHVWVSEIMLQQTQVKTVLPYYERFITALPSIAALANSSTTQLHKLWEGLGYYRRVDNMKRTAEILVDDYQGQLPSDHQMLLALPGIGPYTAAAISSIAFGQAYVALDGNLMRVFARLSAFTEPLNSSSAKKQLQAVGEALLDHKRPGDFNQALMDLGNLICKAKESPSCTQCPLQTGCLAYKQGIAKDLPKKNAPKKRRIENRIIVIPVYDNQILLHKRPKEGLLAGLWEFLNIKTNEKDLDNVLDQMPFSRESILKVTPLKETRHIFSHLEWHMTGYLIHLTEAHNTKDSVWVTPEAMERDYSLPSAFQSFRQELLHYLKT